MGVGYGGSGAVDNCDTGKLWWSQHRAFDVDVGIDESRAKVAGITDAVVRLDLENLSVLHFDDSRKNAASRDIDNLSTMDRFVLTHDCEINRSSKHRKAARVRSKGRPITFWRLPSTDLTSISPCSCRA